ncbi:hypothetical protein GGR58DRAFT_526847 [Xylaria digitata]|nr:hypothetical protein GGR58DRAFT_526847 [Xylaria digitata]
MASTTFSNRRFPFKGLDSPDRRATKEYRKAYAKAPAESKGYNGTYAITARGTIRQTLSFNALGLDERQYRHYKEDPKKYWEHVMRDISPKPWLNYRKVARHLAGCNPDGKPSNNAAWQTGIRWLTKATDAARATNWKDDAEIVIEAIDEELLEAIRIAGDAKLGLGTMPHTVLTKAQDGGLQWMLHDPRDRVIPKCWEWFAKKHGFQYAEALPTMATRPLNLPEPMAVDEPEMQAAVPTRAVAPMQAVIPTQTAVLTQEPVKQPTDTEKFVYIRPEAATRAEKLRIYENEPIDNLADPIKGVALERPDHVDCDWDLWCVIDKNSNSLVKALERCIRKLPDRMHADMKKMMKQALFEGPIEGHVATMIDDAFHKAGIATRQEMRQTITDIIKQQQQAIAKNQHEAIKTIVRQCQNEHNIGLQDQIEVLTTRVESLDEELKALKLQCANQQQSLSLAQFYQPASPLQPYQSNQQLHFFDGASN